MSHEASCLVGMLYDQRSIPLQHAMGDQRLDKLEEMFHSVAYRI